MNTLDPNGNPSGAGAEIVGSGLASGKVRDPR